MRVVIVHNAVPDGASAADRDVLVQVEAVRLALEQLGHEATVIPCTLDLGALERRLRRPQPDVVFNLVESLGGSDRLLYLVPALLDTLQLAYTGNPTEALFVSSSKLLAKQWLCHAGLPTPDWLTAEGDRSLAVAGGPVNRPGVRFGGPYLIKTVFEHGSFGLEEDGIVEVRDRAGLEGHLADVMARLGRACFAERFVAGREFNLSLLSGVDARREDVPRHDAAVEVLPPAEIDFSEFPPGKPRLVGYRAKWDEHSFEYRHTPRRFEFSDSDGPLLDRLVGLARQCWSVFGLRGYARVDFRVDEGGNPWILEINANSCLSPDAGFAAALARAGIPYERAIERIVADAVAPAGVRGVRMSP